MLFDKTNVNQREFAKKAKDNLQDTLQILVKKNKMYGGASMDLGMVGNYVHLHDKVNRLKQLVEISKGKEELAEFEGIEDTLRDIIGYATIGLIILDSQKVTPLEDLPDSFNYPIPEVNSETESPFGFDFNEDR